MCVHACCSHATGGARLAAYLGRLEAHACPLGGGKVHGLRDAVAAAHFGHKGSWEADDELATLLHGPVHLDPLFAQHLWGDLGRQARADMRSPWAALPAALATAVGPPLAPPLLLGPLL